MKHAMRIVVLFATMATMTASPAKAQVGYSAWFNNFNVWNYSGQTANDFELYLGGVSSNQIKTYYTGSYPDYAVTNVADGVIVEWTGSTTANGAYAHFGVHLNPFVNPSAFNLTWTSNGTNIESVQTVQSHWGTTNIAPVNIITNPGPDPVWIVVGAAAGTNAVQLNDLVVGGTVWSNVTIWTTNYLAVGGTFTNNFFDTYGYLSNSAVYYTGLIIQQFSDPEDDQMGQEQLVDFAFVNVGPPLMQITAIQVIGTNVLVTMPSVSGATYQLQFTPSMVPTNWSNVVGASQPGTGSSITLTNFGGATQTQGFYRFAITP